MLKKSIAVVLFAVVAVFLAVLMGWVHTGGVSRQPAEPQQQVEAEQSPAATSTNEAPDNDKDGGAPVSHLERGQLEAEFFKIRDALHTASAKASDGAIDSSPELLKKLAEVVGPFKVDGFPSRGRASPAVISNDPCCQAMDSLEFKNDEGEWLHVTTKGLAKNFYPAAASPLDYVAAMVPLVSFAALPESAATKYADLPVHGANKDYLVRAFAATYNVGDSATPAAPDHIMVFVFAGDRIFFMSSPVEPPDIPECTKKWSDLSDKASVPLNAFIASNRKNQKLLKENEQLEADAIDAAVSCYQREAKNQPFFASLFKQAQSMVDRIHPD